MATNISAALTMTGKQLRHLGKQYPKGHIITVTVISVLIGLILLVTPSEKVVAKRDSIPVPIGVVPEAVVEINETIAAPAPDIFPAIPPVPGPEVDAPREDEPITQLEQASTKATDTAPPEQQPDWQFITVKPGDNLTTLFKRVGLTPRDVHEISQFAKKQKSKSLRKLYPGEKMAFVIRDGQLQRLKRVKDSLESIEFKRSGAGFSINRVVREPEIITRYVAATLEDSLFLAGQKAGLQQKVIMELANVFGGVIDFIYDPRRGDRFNLLYEEKYLDGKKIGTGNILAAQFINRGDTYTALYYVDKKGDTGHYSPEGVSMNKAFLRAPLDFTRISSGFNLRRKHPIHKKILAHRGIDYAAPRGTPVFASGSGRVIEAGYSRANGNYVFIQHGPQYITKYLHLHRKTVRKGQRVKQRQIIGHVGSTGYATGPHLHYEFLVNGVHRNPRTILNKLPKARSLPKEEMKRFKALVQPMLAELQQHQQLLALNQQ